MQQSKKKADLFNDYFKSAFTSNIATSNLNSYTDNSSDTNSIRHDLSCIAFSQEHIAKILHNVNVHKACGPDNLSCHVLKKCATVLAPSLASLYEKLLFWMYTCSIEAR